VRQTSPQAPFHGELDRPFVVARDGHFKGWVFGSFWKTSSISGPKCNSLVRHGTNLSPYLAPRPQAAARLPHNTVPALQRTALLALDWPHKRLVYCRGYWRSPNTPASPYFHSYRACSGGFRSGQLTCQLARAPLYQTARLLSSGATTMLPMLLSANSGVASAYDITIIRIFMRQTLNLVIARD